MLLLELSWNGHELGPADRPVIVIPRGNAFRTGAPLTICLGNLSRVTE